MKTFTARTLLILTAATATLFAFGATALADHDRHESTSIGFDLQVGSHGSSFGISVSDYDRHHGHAYRPVTHHVVHPGHVHYIGGPLCHVIHAPVVYRPAPVIVHHGYSGYGYNRHHGHFGYSHDRRFNDHGDHHRGHGRGGHDRDHGRGHGRGGHGR